MSIGAETSYGAHKAGDGHSAFVPRLRQCPRTPQRRSAASWGQIPSTPSHASLTAHSAVFACQPSVKAEMCARLEILSLGAQWERWSGLTSCDSSGGVAAHNLPAWASSDGRRQGTEQIRKWKQGSRVQRLPLLARSTRSRCLLFWLQTLRREACQVGPQSYQSYRVHRGINHGVNASGRNA